MRLLVSLLVCTALVGCNSAQSGSERNRSNIESCEATSATISDDPAVAHITAAAVRWMESLDVGMAQQARYCLGDAEMHSWTNVPGTRSGGIELREMSTEQQKLAWDLIARLLSESGFVKAKLIANEITQIARAAPLGSHTVALFGDPGQEGAWGFQVDGHHLALNFVVQGADIVLAPAFLGAQPLSVNGRAPLMDEARLGRDLIQTFTATERALAKQDALIGRDVLVGSGRGQLDRGRAYDVAKFEGVGAPISELSKETANVVNEVIDEYVNNLAEPFAGRVRATVDESLRAGYVVYDNRDEEIYYRIYVPNRMLIEYNDISSNHVHTILRLFGEEPFSDYGEYAQQSSYPRTIAEHYRTASHHQVALTSPNGTKRGSLSD